MKIVIIASISGFGTLIPALTLYNSLRDNNLAVELVFLEDITQPKAKSFLFTKYEKSVKKSPVFTQILNRLFIKTASLTYNFLSVSQTIEKLMKYESTDVFICFHGYGTYLVDSLFDSRSATIFEIHLNWGISPHWTTYKRDNTIKIGPEIGASVINLGMPILFNENVKNGERILISGGGWGLGNFYQSIDLAVKKSIPLRIAVGNNRELFINIKKKFAKYIDSDLIEIYFTQLDTTSIINKIKDSIKIGSTAVYPQLFSNKNLHTTNDLSSIPPASYLLDGVSTIITKPGGCTMYESHIHDKKILLTSPINVQEEWNYKYMVSNKLANPFTVESLNIKNDSSGRLIIMPKNALNNITDFIIKNT